MESMSMGSEAMVMVTNKRTMELGRGSGMCLQEEGGRACKRRKANGE